MPSPDHYATLADVNNLVPQVPYTATSKPSSSTVVTLIANVARRMDASLVNLGYTVPVVSGALSLELLREVCSWGALGLAEQIRNTAVPTAMSESGRPLKNIWLQQFDDWMTRVAKVEDPFELPDAPRTDEAVEKDADQRMRSYLDTVDDADGDPEITRAQVF